MGRDGDEVRRFLERVSEVYRLRKAILFGSRARGDHLEDSDIDLILVSEDFEGIPFVERISRMYRFWDDELALEVLCYTPEEFEEKRKRIGLVQDAVREGVEVI